MADGELDHTRSGDIERTQRTLIGEMVALRGALVRERRHKRLLYLIALVLLVLAMFSIVQYRQLRTTVGRVDSAVAKLDENAETDRQQRAEYVRELCVGFEAAANTAADEQRPPRTEVERWTRQARLDQFERDFESNLSALGCDLHLHPVPPPVEDPPAVVVVPAAAHDTTPTGSVPSIPSANPTTTQPPVRVSPTVVTQPPTTTPATTTTTRPCRPPRKKC